jgi:hypothetical protein
MWRNRAQDRDSRNRKWQKPRNVCIAAGIRHRLSFHPDGLPPIKKNPKERERIP